MRKYQSFFTVRQIQTPRGLLVVQDYFPSKARGDKKWREYVIHTAGRRARATTTFVLT